MNKSNVDAKPIAEKFTRSHFWREYKEFRVGDIASFCRVSRYEAQLALKELGATHIRNHLYTRKRVHPLAHAPWRNPTPDDWCHFNPRMC